MKLTSLSVKVTWDNFQVGSKPMQDFHTVTVKGRSSTTVSKLRQVKCAVLTNLCGDKRGYMALWGV